MNVELLLPRALVVGHFEILYIYKLDSMPWVSVCCRVMPLFN